MNIAELFASSPEEDLAENYVYNFRPALFQRRLVRLVSELSGIDSPEVNLLVFDIDGVLFTCRIQGIKRCS